MMGQSLFDNYQAEGQIKKISGLGLLPIETEFLPTKTTHQVKAEFNNRTQLFSQIKNENIIGYEIHMGKTSYLGRSNPIFTIKERSGEQVDVEDGACNKEGNCFGTYIHGLFNNDKFRRGILNTVRKDNGLKSLSSEQISYRCKIEEELDRLAEIISNNLDMDYIRKLLSV